MSLDNQMFCRERHNKDIRKTLEWQKRWGVSFNEKN